MIELPSLRRFAAALAGLCLLAACGDGSGPAQPLTGTYSLRTVDGHPLPASAGCSTITSGSLAIASDSMLLRLSTGTGQDATMQERHGRYTPSATDATRLLVTTDFSNVRDTVVVLGGGRVSYRGRLLVSAGCTGTNVVRADLGFARD